MKHQGEIKGSDLEHKNTRNASHPKVMQYLALLYLIFWTFTFSAQFQVSYFSQLPLILTLSKNVCKRIPGKVYLPSIFQFPLCNTGDFEIFIISQWIFFFDFSPWISYRLPAQIRTFDNNSPRLPAVWIISFSFNCYFCYYCWICYLPLILHSSFIVKAGEWLIQSAHESQIPYTILYILFNLYHN